MPFPFRCDHASGRDRSVKALSHLAIALPFLAVPMQNTLFGRQPYLLPIQREFAVDKAGPGSEIRILVVLPAGPSQRLRPAWPHVSTHAVPPLDTRSDSA